MDSNNFGSGVGPNDSNGPSHSSPPKYVPQFSAATEMILKRIKEQKEQPAGLSSIGINNITGTPPGFENMRRSIMESMRTSQNMEFPTTPLAASRRPTGGRASVGGSGSASRASVTPSAAPTSSAKGKGAAKTKAKAGTKRKRANKEEEEPSTEESDSDMSKLGGDSDSDEEDDGSVSALPKITQSGRQVHKPAHFMPSAYENSPKRRAPSKKSEEHALCHRCGRGHSPNNNMIVFCDGCNEGWHQECHDPKISEEAVKDEKAAWYCADCTKKREPPKIPSPPPNVSWEGRPDGEKRAYLNSLPHPSLVSLLMQAITLHPSLPLFPANTNPQNPPLRTIPYVPQHHSLAHPAPISSASARTVTHPGQYFPSPSTAGLFARAEANPNATINFIRKIPPGSSQSPTVATHPPFQHVTFHHANSAPPTLAAAQQDQDDSRESTPASPPYPKAGTGLMAKLPTDEEDIDWLVDNNDFDAFNHMVFNDHGEKVEENGVVIGP